MEKTEEVTVTNPENNPAEQEEKIDQTLLNQIKEATKDTKNVGIFIDYDNVYYCMKGYAIDISSEEYDLCRLLNEVYGMKRIRTFRAYADFDQVEVKLKSLQERRVQIRNVYGNGKEERFRKNASDIELSLDAIESYYRNEDIDTYVFVSADSDMIPIMSRLMYKGKNVHLYYNSEHISKTQHVNSFCDFSCDLIKLFKVDTDKSKPEYWFETVKNMITNWYANPDNAGMVYGFTWIARDMKKTNSISDKLVGDVLNAMLENNIIENVVTDDGHKGYNIVDEANKAKQEEIKTEAEVAETKTDE